MPGIESLGTTIALPCFEHPTRQRRIAKELHKRGVQLATDPLPPAPGTDVDLVQLADSRGIQVSLQRRAHRQDAHNLTLTHGAQHCPGVVLHSTHPHFSSNRARLRRGELRLR